MSHPYKNLPDYQFWKRAGGLKNADLLDPIVRTKFKISPKDKIVTAGSCFAQHVARKLSASGFDFLVTEPGHPLLPKELRQKHNYGLFSARYGNVYTARQLVQLLHRAFGKFEPLDKAWSLPDGSVVDPFRPQIQPGGFVSVEELLNDQRQHLYAVRRAFKSMSVFVFTLGLTEAWYDRRDGSVYPLAPGVAGGAYDPKIHSFVNFTVEQTVNDMRAAIAFIRSRNPDVKIILTVSPVPLNATAEDRHVLVSTTLSKAVLRVAADIICNETKDCDYFPSFEIITSPHSRGEYFESDRRSVSEDGVSHVMELFLSHYRKGTPAGAKIYTNQQDVQEEHFEKMNNMVQVLCDEEAIDNA